MKKGLVLGKFMPLHNGHIAMINFAKENCDELVLLLCAEADEEMSAITRVKFLNDVFGQDKKIDINYLAYQERNLTSSSVSDKDETKKWADKIMSYNFGIDVIISSEDYGKHLAEFMGIEHIDYDTERTNLPVSATMIRENPYKNWDKIPDPVQEYYYKKICVVGTESTGKTTLAKRLAEHFDGLYVGEMGRELTDGVYDCKYEDLELIAKAHAFRVFFNDDVSRKLLIVDTDINITKSYCKFLFDRELEYPPLVDEYNKYDLYLFLDNDVPHVQDGSRLTEADRNKLKDYHIKELQASGIDYKTISGNWDERFDKAVNLILGLA